jgi:hypothetical protein
MKKKSGYSHMVCLIIVVAVAISCIGIACAVEENTGMGKPKGMDIYKDNVPYSAALGGGVMSAERQAKAGDFNVIVGDDDPGKGDPQYWVDLDVPEEETGGSPEVEEDDSGGGAVIPVYTGRICRCDTKEDGATYDTCVAEFTYTAEVSGITIAVRGQGGAANPPWNEFTGSGMTDPEKWDRCQPTTFTIPAQAFWTTPFWNNIDWKLGSSHSASADCTKYDPRHYDPNDKKYDPDHIPFCSDIGVEAECTNGCPA